MEYVQAKISPSGEMTLPDGLRDRLHLHEGGVVLVREEGCSLVLDSVESRVARARAIVQRYIPPGTKVVDDFIAERRAEAERE